jgi:pimeloyl-ACP methyl ester carboxylesterase
MEHLIEVVVGIFALLAVGAALQAGLTFRDNRRYPPPGQLVDMGGYGLHIWDVSASSSVPVVFEQGLGSSSLLSGVVPQKVAEFARPVVYDRAGLGWSEASPRPRVAAEIVAELRLLLRKADINPPYVVVAHSFGGLPVRLWAYTHPEEVAGMVLLDVGHEGVTINLTCGQRLRSINASIRTVALAPAAELAAAFGLVRLGLALRLIPGHLQAFLATAPGEVGAAIKRQYSRPLSWKTFRREGDGLQESKEQVRQARSANPFPEIPLVVVSATRPNVSHERRATDEVVESWRTWTEAFHGDLARQSEHGSHVYAQTGHEIPFEDPDFVVDAIRQVVEDVRRPSLHPDNETIGQEAQN